MPIYTYQCQSCEVQFERMQKFSDKPLTRCPECSKGKVRRVLVPPAIVFKGSGWYKTDSRTSSTSTTPRTEKTEKSKPAAESDSGGSDKPAKKESKSDE